MSTEKKATTEADTEPIETTSGPSNPATGNLREAMEESGAGSSATGAATAAVEFSGPSNPATGN